MGEVDGVTDKDAERERERGDKSAVRETERQLERLGGTSWERRQKI